MTKKATIESTAEAYLELLAARGVEYLFGNAGTDFAPIIEAYARRGAHGQLLPRPITVPHEAPAVGMAHGYAMITGRPQAVMVHVIVGTANALGGVINAARGNVPMLFTAGRNPITEAGFRGSRERQIHWAQESFDQGAMVREFVKWDYELRNFPQLETVVDRALAITQAEPQGPVYLTLPREVLAERHESFEYSDPSRAPRPSDVVAAPDAIEEAARLLAAARNPVVIAKALGRDPRAVEAMVELAEVAALPVVDHFHTHMNFPQDHPLHAGFDATPYLDEALAGRARAAAGGVGGGCAKGSERPPDRHGLALQVRGGPRGRADDRRQRVRPGRHADVFPSARELLQRAGVQQPRLGTRRRARRQARGAR